MAGGGSASLRDVSVDAVGRMSCLSHAVSAACTAAIAPRKPLHADDITARSSAIAEGPRDVSYRIVSIKILPTATQQCRNYLYDKS